MPLPGVVRAPASTAAVSMGGHKRPHQSYHHQVYYRPYRSLQSLSGSSPNPVEEGPVEEEELEGSLVPLSEPRFVYSEGGIDTGSDDDEGDALIFVPGGSSSGLDWEPGLRLLRVPEGLLGVGGSLSVSSSEVSSRPSSSSYHASLASQAADMTRLQQLHAQLSGGEVMGMGEEDRGSKRRRDRDDEAPPAPPASLPPQSANTHAPDPLSALAEQEQGLERERGRRRKSRRTNASSGTETRTAATATATGGAEAADNSSSNGRVTGGRTTRRRQQLAAAAAASGGGGEAGNGSGAPGNGEGGELRVGVAALRRRRQRRRDMDEPPLLSINPPTAPRHTNISTTDLPPSQPPTRAPHPSQSFVLRSEAVGGSSLDAMMLRVLGEYGLHWHAMPHTHPALQGHRHELPPQ